METVPGRKERPDMKTGAKVPTLAAAALAAAISAPTLEAKPHVSMNVEAGPVVVAIRHNPYRVVAGSRHDRYCPGPGRVRVTYGWAWRPHPRAVWIPPHRGPHGTWVRGCWH
jgi:hypothetical protein